ncbi:MAG: peptidylprolyl isomerase [Betaproteobacteria bacterium]|nr:peptidylprolyl isomerase [Betaproteobacteria bacterium]
MRVFKSAALIAAGVCGITLFSASYAEEAKNVAVVNGVAIPQARMDFVVKMQAQQGQKDSPEMRKQLRDVLITREIITQEAIKQGLDKSEEFQTQIDLARQQVLVNAFLEDYLKKHEPSDADLRAEYEKVKAEQSAPDAKEFKARHILVKKEADAKAILAQLKKGAKFEDLAKKKSEDSGSKNKGGELDWTDGNNMVKPFAEAMRGLKKGETTAKPVQTQYGYHIIRIDDVRAITFPPFEEVKDQVAKQVIGKQRDQMVDELRKAATVSE